MTRGTVSEVARFLGAGVFSYSFGIGLAATFREVLGLPPEVSVGLSLATLVVTNFWIARQWVFRASGRVDHQLARFVLASIAMRGGEYVMFWLLLRVSGAHYLVSMTIAMGISTCVKFVVYRGLVFGAGKTRGPGNSGLAPPVPHASEEPDSLTPLALTRGDESDRA
jgi:putative flippase GtrA